MPFALNIAAALRAVVLLLAVCAAPVHAQTDEIQVYDAGIAAPGKVELTLHNNYTFSGGAVAAFPGGIAPAHSLNGVPEWSVGVTRWLELGLYLPLYSIKDGGALVMNGAKLRALLVSPDAAARTFFYGVNFEFSYNRPQWDSNEFTSEIRPILGFRAGSVSLILNPILDNSFTGGGNLDLAPATRLALALSSRWAVAAEEYADLGPVHRFVPSRLQSHLLFGVIDYTARRLGAELGLGAGLTRVSDHALAKLILTWELN